MQTPTRVGYAKLAKTFPGFDDHKNVVAVPLVPRRRYGQLDFNELAILAAICRATNPRRIFEFGRFDGLTTLCLIQSSRRAEAYTLDLPDRDMTTRLSSDGVAYPDDAPIVARQRWQAAGVANRINEILTDSARFEPDTYKNGTLIGSVDLVFVDGNHKYEYIRRDTDTALRMLAKGGILIWHDYFKRSFPGVTTYIAEFAQSHETFWIESPGHPDYLETSLCYFFPGGSPSG